MAKYTKEERAFFNEVLANLKSIIDHNETIGSTFKDRLEYALKRGFPIDYVPSKNHVPLLFAALQRYQDNDAIEILLEAGADVNVTESKHIRNALLTAIGRGGMQASIIRKILENTQDINHQDMYGYTAFGMLCSQLVTPGPLQPNGYWELLVPMLKAGADPYLCNHWTDWSAYTSEYAEKRNAIVKKIQTVIDNYFQLQNELSEKSSQTYDYEL
ncbi:ankyrin repeat domain-containing protein [uncultured Cloacibacillus sp.]|uniref:ankyrin repeat domain-containing protein n=1 Tax=uncultured Cloacibacillus sp. TaxID=889794 RepID=UPI0026DD6864|nr:hypothetical protein [uncultured Cloacibacillus sp.]